MAKSATVWRWRVEMKLIEPDSWADIERSPDAIGKVAITGHNVMKACYQRP